MENLCGIWYVGDHYLALPADDYTLDSVVRGKCYKVLVTAVGFCICRLSWMARNKHLFGKNSGPIQDEEPSAHNFSISSLGPAHVPMETTKEINAQKREILHDWGVDHSMEEEEDRKADGSSLQHGPRKIPDKVQFFFNVFLGRGTIHGLDIIRPGT